MSMRPWTGWSATCALTLVLLGCDRTVESTNPPSVAAPVQAAASSLARDDRVAHLMGGCAKNEPFLADTSDPIPVLVSNLSSGQVDPLRAAREELAAYGERAIPALRREFDANYAVPYMGQRVQNVVDVLGLMPSEAGREMLLKALVHNQETVRKAAARALQFHARPEDFPAILEAMAASGPESEGDFALALIASDRARTERLLGDWIEAGEAKSLVDLVVVHVCTTHDREVLERWRKLLGKTSGKLRIYLQAAIASQPDEGLLAEMRGWLFDASKPSRRQLVAQALAAVGLSRELVPLLARADPDDALRKAAIDAVAAAPFGEETRAALQAALADSNPEVRDTALSSLCAHEDAGALDAAFTFLLGARPEFESALKALRVPMALQPQIRQRAFETLTRLHRGELGSGYVEDRELIRAIGQVPSVDAARYVMSIGEKAEGVIQGLSAHRWYAQAAGNSGSEGLAYLRGRWATESDPARRMDLVMAGSFEKSDPVRAFLVEVLDSPRSTPVEVLYAADRLARLGPMEFAAPILKRVALKVNDRETRPALNCLLWTWYGAKP